MLIVEFHSQINLQSSTIDISNDYRISLEYGTLRDYLEIFYQGMALETKTVLGLSIANGLSYLHDIEIIHKYLVLCL